jgi:dephospho-CoA kinase
MNLYTVGITGIIGSGKSSIARILKDLGYFVLNADKIAKKLMVESPEIKTTIMKAFGDEAYLENGTINTKYIADLVFQDFEELKKLNKIVHPAVRHYFKKSKTFQKNILNSMVFWDVPLLFEGELWKECDSIILVSADYKTRLDRVKKSGKLTEEEFFARNKEQIPLKEKAKRSDYIIDNTGNLRTAENQLNKILKDLKKRIKKEKDD